MIHTQTYSGLLFRRVLVKSHFRIRRVFFVLLEIRCHQTTRVCGSKYMIIYKYRALEYRNTKNLKISLWSRLMEAVTHSCICLDREENGNRFHYFIICQIIEPANHASQSKVHKATFRLFQIHETSPQSYVSLTLPLVSRERFSKQATTRRSCS